MGGDDILFNEMSGNNGTEWVQQHPSGSTNCVRPTIPITDLMPLPLFEFPWLNPISATGVITYLGTNTPVLCDLDIGDGITSTVIQDWELPQHVNGPHQQHTTNIHTHGGLHVAPSINPDGTHFDNVLLRINPQEDFEKRLHTGIN